VAACAEAADELREASVLYEEQWQTLFEQALVEARLSWCTRCGAVRDSQYLQEAWELYAKSDNYGPVFAHTATKHRACSNCRGRLADAREAARFGAMFVHDQTKETVPRKPETLTELVTRLGIAPRDPLGR
jgi:hypothetical protein